MNQLFLPGSYDTESGDTSEGGNEVGDAPRNYSFYARDDGRGSLISDSEPETSTIYDMNKEGFTRPYLPKRKRAKKHRLQPYESRDDRVINSSAYDTLSHAMTPDVIQARVIPPWENHSSDETLDKLLRFAETEHKRIEALRKTPQFQYIMLFAGLVDRNPKDLVDNWVEFTEPLKYAGELDHIEEASVVNIISKYEPTVRDSSRTNTPSSPMITSPMITSPVITTPMGAANIRKRPAVRKSTSTTNTTSSSFMSPSGPSSASGRSFTYECDRVLKLFAGLNSMLMGIDSLCIENNSGDDEEDARTLRKRISTLAVPSTKLAIVRDDCQRNIERLILDDDSFKRLHMVTSLTNVMKVNIIRTMSVLQGFIPLERTTRLLTLYMRAITNIESSLQESYAYGMTGTNPPGMVVEYGLDEKQRVATAMRLFHWSEEDVTVGRSWIGDNIETISAELSKIEETINDAIRMMNLDSSELPLDKGSEMEEETLPFIPESAGVSRRESLLVSTGPGTEQHGPFNTVTNNTAPIYRNARSANGIAIAELARYGALKPRIDDYQMRRQALRAYQFFERPDITGLLQISPSVYAATCSAIMDLTRSYPLKLSSLTLNHILHPSVSISEITAFATYASAIYQTTSMISQRRAILQKTEDWIVRKKQQIMPHFARWNINRGFVVYESAYGSVNLANSLSVDGSSGDAYPMGYLFA